jgi:hypothetical protein
MTELEVRVAATEATFGRFHGQLLVLGKTDCARMVAFHLKQLDIKSLFQFMHGVVYRRLAFIDNFSCLMETTMFGDGFKHPPLFQR